MGQTHAAATVPPTMRTVTLSEPADPWSCAACPDDNHWHHVPVLEAIRHPDTPTTWLMNVWVDTETEAAALLTRPEAHDRHQSLIEYLFDRQRLRDNNGAVPQARRDLLAWLLSLDTVTKAIYRRLISRDAFAVEHVPIVTRHRHYGPELAAQIGIAAARTSHVIGRRAIIDNSTSHAYQDVARIAAFVAERSHVSYSAHPTIIATAVALWERHGDTAVAAVTAIENQQPRTLGALADVAAGVTELADIFDTPATSLANPTH